MNIKIINEFTGLNFNNEKEMFSFLRSELDFLYRHNKNYTKQQYYKIETLKNIIDNLEV